MKAFLMVMVCGLLVGGLAGVSGADFAERKNRPATELTTRGFVDIEELDEESVTAVLEDLDVEPAWDEDGQSASFEVDGIVYTLTLLADEDDEDGGATNLFVQGAFEGDPSLEDVNEFNLMNRWCRVYKMEVDEGTAVLAEQDIQVMPGMAADTLAKSLENYMLSVGSAKENLGK